MSGPFRVCPLELSRKDEIAMRRAIFENETWRVDERGMIHKRYGYLIAKNRLLELRHDEDEGLYNWPMHIATTKRRWDLELFFEAYVAAMKALAPSYDGDRLDASIERARETRVDYDKDQARWENWCFKKRPLQKRRYFPGLQPEGNDRVRGCEGARRGVKDDGNDGPIYPRSAAAVSWAVCRSAGRGLQRDLSSPREAACRERTGAPGCDQGQRCESASMQHSIARNAAAVLREQRGWRWARSHAFGLQTLGRGGISDGVGPRYGHEDGVCTHTIMDHAYWFRRNRKAAAIAAHLYGWPHRRDVCEDAARRYGLRLEIPDFPSWYYPTPG
jgi:hypothetical protein